MRLFRKIIIFSNIIMARYMRKGAKRVRKFPKKKAFISKAVAAAKDKLFAKKVQRVISKNVETKVAVFQSNTTAYNAPLNAAGDCLRLIPDVNNNFSQGTKIGNEVRMQSLNLRGVITLALKQTTDNNVRIGVRLSIIKCKRFNDYTQAALDFGTTAGSRLLEGSLTTNLGTVPQFNTPINKDYYSVVYDKRFYMSQSLQAVGTSMASTVYTTKFVNIKIPYSRRTIKYDENNSLNLPVNYPYFMLINYCKLDGTSDTIPPSSGESLVSFQYVTTMKYEDA